MKDVRKAMVTGGAGFIGSHIVDALIARGVETTILDNFTTGSMENISQHEDSKLLRIVSGDISRINQVLDDVEEIDVVFHEAAIASVPKSVSDPVYVHDVNVNSSLAVMNFCVRKHVKRMIFASSAAVYGALKTRPASEDIPCAPSSPYGASKFAVEAYLSAYYRTYGLETVGLRYFNVYGPRQRMGEYSGVITVFANDLQQGKRPVIFGDGLQTRDFIHVRDIARANLMAMDSDDGVGSIFNVASGETTTLLELLSILQDITNSEKQQPRFEAARPGDVKFGDASIAKIRSRLGFFPTVSLRDGLRELVDSMPKRVGVPPR